MIDFLGQMTEAARHRVSADRRRISLTRPSAPPPSGRLRDALLRRRMPLGGATGERQLAVIAEVKRRSPSRGAIAPDLDAVAQARAYEAAGADAVSVLTEPSRFGGSLQDLKDVTAAVDAPVLRKDFIVDAYQVWEAAAAGAAAALLIVGALDDELLRDLLEECRACGLDALVEVHDEGEMERALLAGADLVGVNNRDLRSLAVDIAVTERLGPLLPADVLLVSESGIWGAADARRAADAGGAAVLVGESLVRCPHGSLPDLVNSLHGPHQVGLEVEG